MPYVLLSTIVFGHADQFDIIAVMRTFLNAVPADHDNSAHRQSRADDATGKRESRLRLDFYATLSIVVSMLLRNSIQLQFGIVCLNHEPR
jgi:hypothetical protein